jgi:hypothetical protein
MARCRPGRRSTSCHREASTPQHPGTEQVEPVGGLHRPAAAPRDGACRAGWGPAPHRHENQRGMELRRRNRRRCSQARAIRRGHVALCLWNGEVDGLSRRRLTGAPAWGARWPRGCVLHAGMSTTGRHSLTRVAACLPRLQNAGAAARRHAPSPRTSRHLRRRRAVPHRGAACTHRSSSRHRQPPGRDAVI